MFHKIARALGYSYKDLRFFHPTAAAMERLNSHKYLWDEPTEELPEQESSMSTTEVITRVPRVGERVECHSADIGDAGLKMLPGTMGIVTEVEYVASEQDYRFIVMVEGEYGKRDAADGGWGILASYGKHGDDYYNGMDTLDAFWSIFQSREPYGGKRKYMRWAVVHGTEDEPQWSAPFRQGRFTYATYEEALQSIADMVANSAESTLRQVFGEGYGTWRPALYEVYSEDNQDPKGLITDTIGMEA